MDFFCLRCHARVVFAVDHMEVNMYRGLNIFVFILFFYLYLFLPHIVFYSAKFDGSFISHISNYVFKIFFF